MIEKQIISQKVKENQIKEFIYSFLNRASYSHTEIQRTPLGEKIIIYTSRPGLVVGSRGSNIQQLTKLLKEKFNMENPQIEVSEVENPSLNAQSVAKKIVSLFERFGPKRFKSIGYKSLEEIIHAGALGAEVVISGRGVPSTRAKTWRFFAGYLKKSGDISQNYVNKSYAVANLRSGTIGIKVSILHPDVRLPDKIIIREIKIEEVKEEPIKEVKKKTVKKEAKPKVPKKEEKPKKKEESEQKQMEKSEEKQ